MADDAVQIKFGAEAGELLSAMQQVQATVSAALGQVAQAIQGLAAQSKQSTEEIVQSNKKTQDAVSSMAQAVQGSFAKATDAVRKFSGFFAEITGLLAGGAAFGGMISSTTQWASEVAGLAKAMGMSKTEASDFNAALRLIGKTSDDAEAAMFHLVRTMRTNPEALDQLGVAYKDVATGQMLPGNQIFMNALDVVKKYKEGIDQNVVSMTLFGRGAKEMIDFQKLNNDILARGKELAQAYHLELTEDGSQAARAYKIEMNALKLLFEGIYNQVGAALLPVLKNLAQWLNEVGPIAARIFGEALKYVIVVADGVVSAVQSIVAVMAALAAGVVESMPKIGMMEENPWADENTPGYFSSEQRKAIEDRASGVKGIWETLTNDIGKIVEGSMNRINALLAPQPAKLPDIPDVKGAGLSAPDSLLGGGKASPGSISGASNLLATWTEELARIKDSQIDLNAWSAQKDYEFWATKLATTKQGSDEWWQVWHKMAEMWRSLSAEQQAELQKQAQQQLEVQRVQADSAKEHAKNMAEIQRALIAQKQALGQIDEMQALQLQRGIDDRMYQEELQALQKKLSLYTQGQKEYQAVLKEIEKIQDQHNLKMVQDDTKSIQTMQSKWKSLAQSISSSISSAFTGMLSGTQSAMSTLKSLWNSLASTIISGIARITIQWIAGELTKTATTVAQEGVRTGAVAAGAAAREGIQDAGAAQGLAKQAMTGGKAILNDAKQAFSGTYASVSQIPYVGWLLAPIAASAAFAAVAAMSVLSSAAGGWGDIPDDQMAMVHKREMILPARIAETVRAITSPAALMREALSTALVPALSLLSTGPRMALAGIGPYGIPADRLQFLGSMSRGEIGGNFSSHSSSSNVMNRNQGGDTIVNISALDSQDVSRALTRAGSKMDKAVKHLARHGHLDGVLKKYRGR